MGIHGIPFDGSGRCYFIGFNEPGNSGDRLLEPFQQDAGYLLFLFLILNFIKPLPVAKMVGGADGSKALPFGG